MNDSENLYETFQARRHRLTSQFLESRNCFAEIDMQSWAKTCDDLLSRLASDGFKVIVLGEFNRGKSTFINALLGREILPAFATPCTAIIIELRWSESPEVVLHFKNPPPEHLPKGLAAEAVRHIETHRASGVPPLKIHVEDLERYVVIPDPTQDQAKSIAETPYDHAELGWPLEILRNSVEIIDSPGLNENSNRTKVSLDYLGKVDAVIFVLSVHALIGQTEIAVIDRDLRSAGHDHLFFICNRFDELKRAADRDRITQYAYDHLAQRTALGREGVFFVSALDAVIGRQEGDQEMVERSRISPVERALARFLVEQRGRVKLLQPAFQLLQGLKAATFETIPSRRDMLDASLEDLEARAREVLPLLDEAEKRKQKTIGNLERNRTRLRDAVRDAAASHLRVIADDVPHWADSVELESKINAFKFWAVKEQIKGVAQEVITGIQPMIEEATDRWRMERLKPLIEDHLADFSSDAKTELSEFLVEINAIRRSLAGGTLHEATDEPQVGAIERLLAGAGGLFLGGPGSAIEGVTMGYQGMLRSIVPAVMLTIGGIIILHLNPLTIIPALFAVGLFRSWRHGDALTSKAKREVGEGVRSLIIGAIPEQAREIAEKIHQQTEPVLLAIEGSMDREIGTIRQQVESVLEKKRLGESEIDADRKHIAEVERRLHAIEAVLAEFIQDLTGTGSHTSTSSHSGKS